MGDFRVYHILIYTTTRHLQSSLSYYETYIITLYGSFFKFVANLSLCVRMRTNKPEKSIF